MDINRKIKMIAIDKGIPLGELAGRVGLKPSSFAVKLCRGIVRLDDAEKILDELGCELVIVDKETKKVY